MFKKENCFNLGYITKTVGLQGEVVFFMDVDEPHLYAELDSVFVEKQNKLIPFFIESININQKGYAKVKLEGIETEAEAKKITKTSLYLPEEILPELEGNKFYFHEVEGFHVIDQKLGEIGTVVKCLDYPNNLLFEVKHQSKEVLIPANDQVLVEVNRNTKTITVNTPEGLIEVQITESKQSEEE